MRNKEIEELLKQIDRDVQKKGKAKRAASEVINKYLLSNLADDIENYKQRKSNIKKSQDIIRHRPRRDYEKKIRLLEKVKQLGMITDQLYEHKKEDIEKAFNSIQENLEKKKGPKGKENLELNIVIEMIQYILTEYAGYSPTSKAPGTIANLLNLCNISKDKGNEFNRTDINSIIERNLKFDYKKYIKPIINSFLSKHTPPNQITSD